MRDEATRLKVPARCPEGDRQLDILLWPTWDQVTQTERFVAHYESYLGCRFDPGLLNRLNAVRIEAAMTDPTLGEVIAAHLDRAGEWTTPIGAERSIFRPVSPEDGLRALDQEDLDLRRAVVWPNLGRPALQDKRLREAIAAVLSTRPEEMKGVFAGRAPGSMISWFASPRHETRWTYPMTDAERALLAPLHVPYRIFGATLPLAQMSASEDSQVKNFRTHMTLAGYRLDAGLGAWVDGTGTPLRLRILAAPDPLPHETRAMAFFANRFETLGLRAVLIRSASQTAHDERRASGDWDLAFDFDASPARFTSRFSDRLHIARVKRLAAAEIEAMNGDADPRFQRADYLGLDDPAMDALLDALGAARRTEDWDTALRAIARLSLHQLYVFPLWTMNRTDALFRKPAAAPASLALRALRALPDRACNRWNRERRGGGDSPLDIVHEFAAADRHFVPGTDAAFDYDAATGRVRLADYQRKVRFTRRISGPETGRDAEQVLSVGMPLFFAGGRFSDRLPGPDIAMRVSHGAARADLAATKTGIRYTARGDLRAVRDSLRRNSDPMLTLTLLHAGQVVATWRLPAEGLGACLDETDARIEEILR